MNTLKQISIPLLLAAIIALAVGCQRTKAKPEQASDSGEIAVKTITVKTIRANESVAASGFVSSSKEARLAFKTGGVIQKIYVEEGQSVRKGQLLATLNLTEINTYVEQARLGVEKAQRDYDRATHLYQDTVATLEQMQNATTGLNVAKEQLASAQFNKSYSEIRAASDGVIVKKLMNEGEIVSPGLPVFYMTADGANDWVVKVGIADKDWARLRIGNTATILIDAYPNEIFHAKVSLLSLSPDPMSGLYQAELRLDDTGKPIVAGLFAKSEIKPGNEVTYISAPIDAVVEGNGKDAFVFIADHDKARKIPVRIAFIRDGQVMISSGISAGIELITDGSAYLTDGSPIRISK